MQWVEDVCDAVEVEDGGEEVYRHAYNVCRIIDPRVCLAKLLVLPLQQHNDSGTDTATQANNDPTSKQSQSTTRTKKATLHLLLILAHQISDGLTCYTWLTHFLHILNTPTPQILSSLSSLIHPAQIQPKLPPPQEALYPAIPGSRARQRWFWALTRVLRHVAKPLPPTFPNPLFRERRLDTAPALPEKFAGLFSYQGPGLPPMRCGTVAVSLSLGSSQRLMALCRKAHVSIGAGCFALAGLAMMEIHESRYPEIPDELRPAFAASFPLNPRAFFADPPQPDSCMLAFSEGIVMPFLPSRLPVEGRFGVVARHANRGLRVYQKRLKVRKGGAEEMDVSLDKHSPGRLLAMGYVAQIERVEAKLPPQKRTGERLNPQGDLRPKVGEYGATCGVSSVGSLAAFFRRGQYDLEDLGERDFAADFRQVKMGVRARENEFLIGSSTSAEGIISFGVSYDANAISEDAANMWAEKMSGLLEKGDGSRL